MSEGNNKRKKEGESGREGEGGSRNSQKLIPSFSPHVHVHVWPLTVQGSPGHNDIHTSYVHVLFSFIHVCM